MATRLKKACSKADYKGYVRYTVWINGTYVGWVSRFDDDKLWNAHVTSELAGWVSRSGRRVSLGERTRRDAVREIEIYYASYGWRLESV